MLTGMILIVLLYQIPAYHDVDIGHYDAAYVQGFYEAEMRYAADTSPLYLSGSDEHVRWSRDSSFLLFPQAGLPGSITLRLRGWRQAGSPPHVRVLLNRQTLLADFQSSGDWEEHRFTIDGGLSKPSDVLIEIQSTTAVLPDDGRSVGVLLDRAIYQVSPGASGFITPNPFQVFYGAVVALLLRRNSEAGEWDSKPGRDSKKGPLFRVFAACDFSASYSLSLLVVGVAFLFLYRLQPPLYPYPLRGLLPGLIIVLLVVQVVQHAPALLRRPAVLEGVALASVALWTVRVLWTAQEHVTLSVPGVEKDFRVFATRTGSLEEVFRADGFYNLGYPLLLWLVSPLTAGNAFLAARLVAGLSGTVLLLAGYALARLLVCNLSPSAGEEDNRQLPVLHLGALLALLILAGSPLVVQYTLYVGSDMPFAALVTMAVALLLASTHLSRMGAQKTGVRWMFIVFLAGCAAGGAFLVRHLGLVLLVWGVGHCIFLRSGNHRFLRFSLSTSLFTSLLFMSGFLLLATPQLLVNTLETGQPLYNEQAKNVWLAVYTGVDWGRWSEVPNTISLSEVVLRDPLRFLNNWWRNLLGFLGTGAEDTTEFGQALQLRLLSFPANWLAVIGLSGWFWSGIWGQRPENESPDSERRAQKSVADNQLTTSRAHSLISRYPTFSLQGSALWFMGLYVLAVGIAFILPRFFLPLVPIYAAAAAWTISLLIVRLSWGEEQRAIARKQGTEGAPAAFLFHPFAFRLPPSAFLLLLLLFIADGFDTGTRYVLDQQPADEVAAIQLTLATLQPGEQVLTHLPAEVPIAKYSALAHRVIPWSALEQGRDAQTVLIQARSQGAAYLLWDELPGPPPLPNPDAARVGEAGRYRLYRL